MKRVLSLVLFFHFTITCIGQVMPDIPQNLDFAGVNIILDADAQKIVRDEIRFQLLPESRILQDKLNRIQLYFPIIENILEEEEVPEDFKYLAIVESSLQADIVSSSNAVGFWQLKRDTADELGLKINDQVDERKNIYAATHVAAKYLKRNNAIYKNWVSTLYSYYLGAKGISKIVPAEWTYANEVKLNGKTDRYILKTIAHQIAFEYRLNRLHDPANVLVEYKNAKGKTLSQIATDLNLDINDLSNMNLWLSAKTIPTDKDYSVAIQSTASDAEKLTDLIKNNATVAVAKTDFAFPVLKKITTIVASPRDPIFYEINNKKGIMAQADDDVVSLCQKAAIRVNKFLDINDMTDKDLVKEGKIYYLERKEKQAKVPFHTVLEGQTMWEVAQMYGINLDRLMRYNLVEAVQRLQTGRVLWLQESRPNDSPVTYILPQENTIAKPKSEDSNAAKIENSKDNTIVIVSPPAPKIVDPVVENPPPVIAGESTPINNASTSNEVQNSPAAIIDNNSEAIVLVDNGRELLPTQNENVRIVSQETVSNTKNIDVSKPSKPKKVSNKINHTTTAGETLYSIARSYNVSPHDLAAWNGFSIEEKVKIGQMINIIAPKNTGIEKPKNTEATKKIHIVATGETLFSISQKFNVSTKELQLWNKITDNNIRIGQKIIIAK